jgi:hypothetical protein
MVQNSRAGVYHSCKYLIELNQLLIEDRTFRRRMNCSWLAPISGLYTLRLVKYWVVTTRYFLRILLVFQVLRR